MSLPRRIASSSWSVWGPPSEEEEESGIQFFFLNGEIVVFEATCSYKIKELSYLVFCKNSEVDFFHSFCLLFCGIPKGRRRNPGQKENGSRIGVGGSERMRGICKSGEREWGFNSILPPPSSYSSPTQMEAHAARIPIPVLFSRERMRTSFRFSLFGNIHGI